MLETLLVFWKPIAAAFAAIAVFFTGRASVKKGESSDRISEVHNAFEKAKTGDTSGIDRAISEL